MAEKSPTYVAVLLPAPIGDAALPGDQVYVAGPFTDKDGEGSAWRAARTFVEDNIERAGGKMSRWVVCEVEDAGSVIGGQAGKHADDHLAAWSHGDEQAV